MIKWLGRTLMLVVAALVVSGIAYGIVQSSGDSVGAPIGRGEFRPPEGVDGDRSGQLPQRGNFPNGARGGREGFNLFGIDQVLRPLIIIAAIVVIVAPIITLTKKRTKARSAPTVSSS